MVGPCRTGCCGTDCPPCCAGYFARFTADGHVVGDPRGAKFHLAINLTAPPFPGVYSVDLEYSEFNHLSSNYPDVSAWVCTLDIGGGTLLTFQLGLWCPGADPNPEIVNVRYSNSIATMTFLTAIWDNDLQEWYPTSPFSDGTTIEVTQTDSTAIPAGCCCDPSVIDPDNPQDTEFSVDFEGFCNPSDLCTLANSAPGPTWNNSQIGYGCDWDDPSSCQATMWRLRKFFENDTQRAWRGFFAASGGISGECGSEATNYLNLALPKGASTDSPTLTLAIFGAGGRTWTWDGAAWNPVSTTNCSAVMPTCVRKYAIDPTDIYYHMSFSQGAPGADPSLYSYSMTMSYFTGLGFATENLSLAFDADTADYTSYLGTGDVSAGEVTLLFFKRGSISYSPPRLIYGSPTGAVSNLYYYGPNATHWQRTQFGGSGIPENGDHWAQVTAFARSP